MKARRVLSIILLSMVLTSLVAPSALAAEEKTVLTYSIKEARASLWQIHYPQTTFMTEKYAPCDVEADQYGCDRTRYNQEPGSCPQDVALGRIKEAPETPTPEEADGGFTDDGGVGLQSEWPRGNPVTVVHGLASGHMASTPESGGFASMYYVDNSGRRETEAHVESDGFVSNRNDYEERCAVVDAFSETSMYPGPFSAHMLSRAKEGATYNMAALTTLDGPTPPGGSKESVSIVKLWEADGRVHGVLTSTVRGATLGDGAIIVDAVRSVISFSSDGTEKGLVAVAKTEALGLTLGGTKIASLDAGQIIPLGEDAFLGVIRPVVQVADEGHRVTIRAPGLFVAARGTGLDGLPIPEDPIQDYEQLNMIRTQLCEGLGTTDPPCTLTAGGKLKPDQVVFVAGAILDAGVGRVSAFDFLPGLPTIPLPQLPTIPVRPIVPPVLGDSVISPPPQPVALPRFETRSLGGSPWPAAVIVVLGAIGFMMIMGRWTMRFGWARSLSRYPPFPAFGWAYRAFLKG